MIAADVGDAAGRQQLLDRALQSGPIHAIICNAGADLLTTDLRSAPSVTNCRRSCKPISPAPSSYRVPSAGICGIPVAAAY
ncbi:MAG UNVERIFIED_CONTAM: hypothetical protein LVR18_24165 [Planctomycetaceae bacterium]